MPLTDADAIYYGADLIDKVMFKGVQRWPPVLGPALLVNATFTTDTDILLSAYTPELGAGFTVISGPTPLYVLAASGTVRPERYTLGDNLILSSEVPPTADYIVEAQFDAPIGSGCACVARSDGSASGDRYEGGAFLNGGNTYSEIHKYVGGVQTILWSGDIFGFVTDDWYKLELIGTSISLYRNGSLLQTVVDSSVTAKGSAGVRAYSANSGAATDGKLMAFKLTG